YCLVVCAYLSVPGCFFFQAEDGIRDFHVTGVQTCALPISWFADLDQKIYDVAWREAQHAYPSDGRFTKKQFQTLLDMLAAAGKKYTINYDDVVYDRAVG